MTRWRPSSPVAEAPGQWGSAWTYTYPAQERIDALRRLLDRPVGGAESSPRGNAAGNPAAGGGVAMSDHIEDLFALQHWRTRAAELQRELDEARALHERDMEAGGADLYRRVQQAERERDNLRALLREIDDWFRQEGAFPDYIQARIVALLGGRDE